MKNDTVVKNLDERQTDLDKRLISYSALASLILTVPNLANGSVVKTDPADQSGLQTVTIDFDNDSNNDLIIKCGVQTGVAANDIRVSNAGLMVANYDLYGSSWWYGLALNSGYTIGPGAQFATMHQQVLIYSGNGPWEGVNQKFIGVKFDISGATHYGWIKLSCTGSPEYRLTLYEYAYETTADLGIKAGSDQSLPVELSSFNASFINRAVNLSWTTQSELDNIGFILERCIAGENGSSPDWQEIASYQTHDELKSAGNTSARTDYTFVDITVQPNTTYLYRISDVSTSGVKEIKDIIEITTREIEIIPEETALDPVFPNPFNAATQFCYHLSEDAEVSLIAVDLMGRTVRNLIQENQPAGSYHHFWNGKDNNGNTLSSGVYLLVLKAGEIMRTQKVNLLK